MIMQASPVHRFSVIGQCAPKLEKYHLIVNSLFAFYTGNISLSKPPSNTFKAQYGMRNHLFFIAYIQFKLSLNSIY